MYACRSDMNSANSTDTPVVLHFYKVYCTTYCNCTIELSTTTATNRTYVRNRFFILNKVRVSNVVVITRQSAD